MTDLYDCIVVGGGGSGLAAAVSAGQQGGRVLLLEKQSQLGGTTGIAIGSFTAANTRWQKARGISDSAADHAVDAGRFAAADIEVRNNDSLRSFFLAHAAETLDWLTTLGLSFVGPSPEPPNRVPRMHNVVPNAKAYIAAMQLELARLGGVIVTGAAVTDLLRDGDRVVGVRAAVRTLGGPPSEKGVEQEFHARKAVILAAGDYASAPDLIRRFKGTGYDDVEGINPFAGGDGQRLVERAGGQLLNMDVTYGPELRFVAPARRGLSSWLPATPWAAKLLATTAHVLPAWAMRAYLKRLLVTWQHPENALFTDGAILVNRLGQRFCDERSGPARELAVARQPDKLAFILLDGRLVTRYSQWPCFVSTAPDIAYAYVADYLRLRPDVAIQAPTLTELAARRGLDATALRRSLDDYNAYATGQATDPFGREGDSRPLTNGPYVLLGPAKAYFTTTEGGAAIDQQFRVLDPSGGPIPGLYAVGQNGLGGMILWGHGLHIAWAITSGRLAGQLIMQSQKLQDADAGREADNSKRA